MTHYDLDLTKPDKFREAILYISQKSETDRKFSVTKLNKILFFSDFIFFGKTGKSITGQNYQKLEYGPAPKAMKPVSDEMEKSRELTIRPTPYFGHIQKKPIALREANLEPFSAEEIAVIDEVIKECWNLSATDISDVSHGFIGWQIAKMNEGIPYGLAWIDESSEFTEAEVRSISKMKPLSREEKKNLEYS